MNEEHTHRIALGCCEELHGAPRHDSDVETASVLDVSLVAHRQKRLEPNLLDHPLHVCPRARPEKHGAVRLAQHVVLAPPLDHTVGTLLPQFAFDDDARAEVETRNLAVATALLLLRQQRHHFVVAFVTSRLQWRLSVLQQGEQQTTTPPQCVALSVTSFCFVLHSPGQRCTPRPHGNPTTPPERRTRLALDASAPAAIRA